MHVCQNSNNFWPHFDPLSWFFSPFHSYLSVYRMHWNLHWSMDCCEYLTLILVYFEVTYRYPLYLHVLIYVCQITKIQLKRFQRSNTFTYRTYKCFKASIFPITCGIFYTLVEISGINRFFIMWSSAVQQLTYETH